MADINGKLRYVPTTCPYCGVGCGLNLVVNDGKLVGVEPYKRSPINEGKLCPKGATCWEFVQSPDRLTKPLIKKNGEFVEASWDEAYDLIASKFTEISDKYGPDALGFQVSCRTPNEECYIMQKLARVAFKTNNIDNCARICHGPSVAGLSLSFGSGAATNPFEDVKNADVIFMIGANSVEAHPLAARRVLQAKKAGKKVIVCDPRYTPTARLADEYVRYNPSTNIALINSIMYWIIQENLHDKEFIEKRTSGFDELKKTVENYAEVESITGVPTERVKEIARAYATADNAVIIYCLGITELSTGTDNVRSLGNLAMLTGNVGRPGVGVNPLRGQNNVQGACDMGAYPNVFSGYQKCEDDATRKRMEELWGVTGLASNYGVTLTEQITQCGDPIKAMYIFALNPVVSYPDSNHVMRSLEKLDFLVVQDLFMTETAKYADVILPGASFAEKDGTFTSGERRVNRIRKAVDTPGDAKEDWQIFVDLAHKLNLNGFDFNSPEDIWNDMRRVTPSMAGISYERMEKPESVHWPCPTLEHPGTPILHREKFSSADGLGHFFGIEHRPPAEVADAEYPFTLMTGRLIFHYHTRTQTGRAKILHQEVPEAYVQINNEDAARLSIQNGEKIRLKGRRGQAEALARVTDEVAPGVLMMTMHFGGVGSVNQLTNTALDPLSKMPELKHSAVAVEKITGVQ
ncbi:formate dehydrogenase subunit alpha [Methanoculleus sp. Afa-1]|uniref:Formate dehydrogenase subunit alpha n=1 Tax=Methanoculleus formosensis TaxID=2590886 RepID=A0A9E4ZLK8_9EURY|nr:formate dehydrogenase subunit alpha [Methanoculleus sp. Afa-1]MCT8338342.1 formate dehydrogenase subunit alpha [Methanoculleus sp. Afa-1]